MMKVLPLFFIAGIISCSAHAQITKGSIFLGGDISASTQKSKRAGETINKQSSLTISPVIGKAIKENLVLGINAGYSFYDNDLLSNGSQESKGFNAGLFLRKYKNIGTTGFYVFIQGGLGANYFSQEVVYSGSVNSDLKRTTIGLAAYPGITYAISRKVFLESGLNNLLMINYVHEKGHEQNSLPYKTNGFSISSSLNNASSLSLGFRVIIGR